MKRIRLTNRISFRLTVVYVTTLLVSCLTIGLVVYSSLTDVIKRNEADILNRRIAEYRFAYLDGGTSELIRLVNYHKLEFPEEKSGLILENISGVVFRSDGPFENIHFENQANDIHIELLDYKPHLNGTFRKFEMTLKKFILAHGWTEILKFFNFEVIYVSKTSITPETKITYFQTFSTSEKAFVKVRMLALFLLIVFFMIGLTIGYHLSRRVILPIQKFINTIDRLEAGETSARVTISEGGNEFALLADEFNQLMNSKDALVQNINETLDTIAHEIRTPLTRFRIGAEVSKNHEVLLREGLEASEHIAYLLTTILESSKASNGIIHLEKTQFLLSDLLTELKDIYLFLLEEKKIDLEISVDGDVTICADRRLLLQAINNLLDNAIKYTPYGGKVSLIVRKSSENLEIIVADTGDGIPAEEHLKIWQRFYRSRNHHAEKGYGIGLSVVKAIAELHHGTVSLESKIGRGSIFSIMLPRPF